MSTTAASQKLDRTGTTGTTRRGMTFRALASFLALTFGLSWGIILLAILFPEQIFAIFGEVSRTNPLFILAVYAPGIAGVLLVWRHYGLEGLGSYMRRLMLWRMPVAWWVFLVIGIPAIVYLAAAIKGMIADHSRSPPGTPCCRRWPSRCSSARSRSSVGAAWRCRCSSTGSRHSGRA